MLTKNFEFKTVLVNVETNIKVIKNCTSIVHHWFMLTNVVNVNK